MDFNIILMCIGAAAFVLPVVYMLGYSRHEKKHAGWAADTRETFNIERAALIDHYEIHKRFDVDHIKQLQDALTQSDETIAFKIQELNNMEGRWQYADSYRKALVDLMVEYGLWNYSVHSNSPGLMLTCLLSHVRDEALDPAISKPAKNLITKGVRKGAKQGREQMRKLMQKTIDTQAMSLELYRSDLNKAEEDFSDLLFRKNTAAQAYNNVMMDKMPLVSIRKSFKAAVLNETGRLRSLKKKGE